MNLETLVN